ncbi:MAG: membrane protein insertion efficiency factor YidD [Candidatus Cloacimonadia bacterium]
MLNKIFVWMIIFYQRTISNVIPPACRFTPSCSEYARQAFVKHSFFKALNLSIKRVLKCHPFHPGGDDPVP